jgi:glycosyltransferase involved in cell wall biosynthesis
MRMYRDATAIVCVTESFIRTLRSRGIETEKLHFVPNGIEPSFWQSADREAARADLGVADGEVLACYVGTIGMAHGLGTVLQAAATLRRSAPNVKVLIVGDGAELEPMRAIAARDHLTNVTFTGLVAREKVPAILAAADLALVTLKPSDVFKTVLPSKMFEAMAARRAILLGVEGEARATLERAEGGVAFQPGDADALATAIAQLAGDRDARDRMGASGGAFVEREFSRQTWARRYISVLARLPISGHANQPAVSPALE